jgi:hypothetical protein
VLRLTSSSTIIEGVSVTTTPPLTGPLLGKTDVDSKHLSHTIERKYL